jgi:hypothetical protein
MGGGNAQKSKMAREKNLEKLKGGKGKRSLIPLPPLPRPDLVRLLDLIPSPFCFRSLAGSQLEANKKAMNIQVRRLIPPIRSIQSI